MGLLGRYNNYRNRLISHEATMQPRVPDAESIGYVCVWKKGVSTRIYNLI